jgi:M-phase inducer phosphatase 2
MKSGSMESTDDEYMYLFEMETLDENSQLPNDLCSLISGDIKTSTVCTSSSSVTTIAMPKQPISKKSISMNDAHIMNALTRSTLESDLIGDFSKRFCLPMLFGDHSDLKSISTQTLADLLKGDFTESVGSFQIIYCRYPYEFKGGHIRGAQNLYTEEKMFDVLVKNRVINTEQTITGEAGNRMDSNMVIEKRNILIFHCEYSSQRGPKLSRLFRNNDRKHNEHAYPTLNYPEIYLLHGGYKEFFKSHSDLCDPMAYQPMMDASSVQAFRHFRAKSKSGNGEIKASFTNRLVKSRSRLVL